jgi:hypothetical protein
MTVREGECGMGKWKWERGKGEGGRVGVRGKAPVTYYIDVTIF